MDTMPLQAWRFYNSSSACPVILAGNRSHPHLYRWEVLAKLKITDTIKNDFCEALFDNTLKRRKRGK